jgi:hypothetical protein
MTTFSQIYSKDQEQKVEQKCLKSLQSGQKRNKLKVVNKEGVIIKEIGTIKNKQAL